MCAIIGAELNEGLGVYEGGRAVDATHLAKLVVINNDLWALVVNITKASILAQYLRIFSSRIVRSLCYVLFLLLVPAVLWIVFAGTFLCRPVAKLWNPSISGECMDPHSYWLSAAGINIGLDFLVLLLPLPAITSLHLPRRQKICIVLVFLLGFFVCIVSIVRLSTVDIYASKGELVGKSTCHFLAARRNRWLTDLTESGIQAVTWSAVEANVGIICASLLALKPLLLHFCPCLLDSDSIPSHRLRLPTMQTCRAEQGSGSDEPVMRTTTPTAPSSPISSNRLSGVRTTESGSFFLRASVAGTLPGVSQTEGVSFVDMLDVEPEMEERSRPSRR